MPQMWAAVCANAGGAQVLEPYSVTSSLGDVESITDASTRPEDLHPESTASPHGACMRRNHTLSNRSARHDAPRRVGAQLALARRLRVRGALFTISSEILSILLDRADAGSGMGRARRRVGGTSRGGTCASSRRRTRTTRCEAPLSTGSAALHANGTQAARQQSLFHSKLCGLM